MWYLAVQAIKWGIWIGVPIIAFKLSQPAPQEVAKDILPYLMIPMVAVSLGVVIAVLLVLGGIRLVIRSVRGNKDWGADGLSCEERLALERKKRGVEIVMNRNNVEQRNRR